MKIIGQGSVTRIDKKPRSKCRKWKLRVKTDEGEKSKRITGTYSFAKEQLQVFLKELENKGNSQLFSTASSKWLHKKKCLENLSSSTISRYEYHVRLTNSCLGDVPIQAVTKAMVENVLIDINSTKQGGVSASHLKTILKTIKAVLEDAVDNGLIENNPAGKVSVPSDKKRKRRALDREEYVTLLTRLDAMELDSCVVAAKIAALSGLRCGEISALD